MSQSASFNFFTWSDSQAGKINPMNFQLQIYWNLTHRLPACICWFIMLSERQSITKIAFKMAVISFCSNSPRTLLSMKYQDTLLHLFSTLFWSDADLSKDRDFYHLTLFFFLNSDTLLNLTLSYCDQQDKHKNKSSSPLV